MTKDQIESVLERVRHWPQDRQEEAIDLLVALEAMGDTPYVLSDDERKGVERGSEDVRRGNFASDEEVAALFAKYGK